MRNCHAAEGAAKSKHIHPSFSFGRRIDTAFALRCRNTKKPTQLFEEIVNKVFPKRLSVLLTYSLQVVGCGFRILKLMIFLVLC